MAGRQALRTGRIEMGRAERAREAEPQAPASRNQSFVVTQTDGGAPAILTREGTDKDRATAAEGYRQWQESIDGNVKCFADRRDAERAVQTYGGQIMDCPEALQFAPRASRQPIGAEWAL